MLVLAAADGPSGYATQTASAVARRRSRRRARPRPPRRPRGRAARVELEPGVYRAVLEPYALAELLQYFAWDSFGGARRCSRSAATSPGGIGERVFDEKVTIADDALDPRGLPKAFDFEGDAEASACALVEDGVARGVVWDRRTAKRAGGDAQARATRRR